MSLAGAAALALAGIVFHELFVRLGVLADARRLLEVGPEATRVIRSATLSDGDKERAMRRMSVAVLRDTLRFVSKLALVLVACGAVALVVARALGLSGEALGALLVSWPALALLVAFVPLYGWLRRRLGRARDARG